MTFIARVLTAESAEEERQSLTALSRLDAFGRVPTILRTANVAVPGLAVRFVFRGCVTKHQNLRAVRRFYAAPLVKSSVFAFLAARTAVILRRPASVTK